MALTLLNLFPVVLHWTATVLMVGVIVMICVQNDRLNEAATMVCAGFWLFLLVGIVWKFDSHRTDSEQVLIYGCFTFWAFANLKNLMFPRQADKAYESNRKIIERLFGSRAAARYAAAIERYKSAAAVERHRRAARRMRKPDFR
jgi:hypothetical protein